MDGPGPGHQDCHPMETPERPTARRDERQPAARVVRLAVVAASAVVLALWARRVDVEPLRETAATAGRRVFTSLMGGHFHGATYFSGEHSGCGCRVVAVDNSEY